MALRKSTGFDISDNRSGNRSLILCLCRVRDAWHAMLISGIVMYAGTWEPNRVLVDCWRSLGKYGVCAWNKAFLSSLFGATIFALWVNVLTVHVENIFTEEMIYTMIQVPGFVIFASSLYRLNDAIGTCFLTKDLIFSLCFRFFNPVRFFLRGTQDGPYLYMFADLTFS